VKDSDDRRDHSVATAVLVMSLLATFVTVVSFVVVARQHVRTLGELRSIVDPLVQSSVASLQSTAKLLVILIFALCVLLVLSSAAMLWLFRRSITQKRSLRQVKTLAYNILAGMDQGVITTDAAETITSINSAASALLGIEVDCVGEHLEKIQPPGVPLTSVIREVATTRRPVLDHDFALHRDGRTIRLRGDVQVLKDADGQPLSCVIHLRNVTDRVLIEERMSRMERFISLGSLASGLHHEIKNPLTALSIHVQLLEEGLREMNCTESVEQIIGVLNTEVHRLNGVLESFRSFTNLQRLTIRDTDVVDVLDNVTRLVEPQATQQEVQIELRRPEPRLPLIPLDTEKFEQAVLNLVINALEAMPSGGTLSIDVKLGEEFLQVEVADTGVGIPEDLQSSVFKPYFSTKTRGSGMGLALTEKLISQHGGNITFQSDQRGTAFCVLLPLKQCKDPI
jgi:PAS domain S-box-containing protein